MNRHLTWIVLTLVCSLVLFTGCSSNTDNEPLSQKEIEEKLNLANQNPEWTYDKNTDSWTLSPVVAVANPEIEEEQSISVNIPGPYVTGIDTTGDGEADTTAQNYSGTLEGNLVIDEEAEITSTNGQVYTASTAPIIFNTGAAGYGSQKVSSARGTYAEDGYINVETGNRGKQDTVTEDGKTVYTGDAPSALVDQKSEARYLKYNILLGNLPGNVDYLVTTGGSGGGAHALMFAATSNNPDFYDYEIESGAVGVYKTEDGEYSTLIEIDGNSVEISDGAWGCVAYSPITSLYDADMALAFEYNLNTDYNYNTEFQAQLAEYLSESYMNYINEMKLSASEADLNLDINGDGDTDDTVDLQIEYDPEKYASTNGYGGTYLDLYLAKFEANLNEYLNSLDYADDWTWFDQDGNKLSDEQVAQLTLEEKKLAFIEGRYTKSSNTSTGRGGMNGRKPSDTNGIGTPPDLDASNLPDGGPPEIKGAPDDLPDDLKDNGDVVVGTPDAGTTQSSSSKVDSNNYDTFDELLKSYEEDIESIEAGDKYGNNIVDLYNPLNYIGDSETEKPKWVKAIMGAQEGDISMFNSLLIEVIMASEGINTDIEWQWDGGHVPSEIFGNSLALTVDEMYGEYVNGAVKVEKQAAETQTTNGSADSATGSDISGWVETDTNGDASFSLSDVIDYRTARTSKSVPGFDVIDYGQEDYVFGNSETDARHWNSFLLEIFNEHKDELSSLFNSNK